MNALILSEGVVREACLGFGDPTVGVLRHGAGILIELRPRPTTSIRRPLNTHAPTRDLPQSVSRSQGGTIRIASAGPQSGLWLERHAEHGREGIGKHRLFRHPDAMPEPPQSLNYVVRIAFADEQVLA